MMEGLCFVLMFVFARDTVLCQDFKLFVADSQGEIYTLNETGEIIDTITTNEPVVDLTIDSFLSSPDDISILYSANEGGNGWIYRHNLTDGTSESLLAVEIQGYNAFATSLQVDPTSGNIFFTRILDGIQGYHLISAQTPYADQTTILPDLNSPSAIAVHAGRGLLFWSDSSNSPFIGSATMAGTESRQMIKTDIEEPTGLAIDFTADKLYWADASLNKIESCDFDGGDRNVVLFVPNTEIIDLVLDGDYLYYNSRTNDEIMRVHVSDSGDLTTFATISVAATLNGMTIYSPNLLHQTKSNMCSPRFGLGDCSTICLPTPSGHSCACGYDIELLENGKSCENAIVCSDSLPNGVLDISCTRHRFETCNFTCDEGFQQDIVVVSCNGVDWNDANPCSWAVLGGICSEPGTSCHDANTTCDPDKGKCSCKEGFFDNDGDPSNFDGTCVQKALVGSKCVTNVSDSCMDENALCDPVTKHCICGQDFYDDDGDSANVGGVCIPKKAVGETCSVDAADSCSDVNAVCNFTTIQCTCLPEYYDIDGDSSNIGGNCIKKAGLQENCSIQAAESCYDENAICDSITVKCSCSDGYSAVGGMCTVDCLKLTLLENGYYSTADVSEGTIVTAECNQNFTLFGNSSLLCLSGGIWNSPFPECKKDCKELSPSAHELFNNTDVKEGSTVGAACDNGYSMFGVPFITCLPGGIWDEDTSRECRKDCPTPTELVSGYPKSTEIKEGSKVSMACNNGYSVFGNPILTCLPGGIWERDQDLECREDCPYINITAQLNTTETKEGTAVYIKCNKDFSLFGDATLTCLSGGTWDAPIPDCKKDCQALEPFPDGQLDTPAVLEGTLATVTCDPDHRLSGSDIIECMPGGIWSSIPTCMKDCPQLEEPVNGYLDYHGNLSTGTLVNIMCDDLYTIIGHSELRCLAGGLWDLRKLPECKKNCDRPDYPNNGWVETTGLSHGSIAMYRCYVGYLMTGKAIQTCLDGTWSDAMPTCNPVDCGEVNITNGNVIGSTLYRGWHRVRCDPGYYNDGYLWCGEDGLWVYEFYHFHTYDTWRTKRLCHPIDCYNPPTLSSTFMHYNGTLVGSIATYYFAFDTELVGTLQLMCKEDGLWTGENIECSLNEECEWLNDHLLDGSVEVTGYYCGAIAVYKCNKGYTMEGTPIRHCMNGIWNGPEPICSRIDCGYIHVDNGVLEGSTYYGDSLQLVCDSGYQGDALFECRRDGSWENIVYWLYTSVLCQRKYCSNPVAPNNGLAVYHGTRFGDVAAIVCEFGYKLTGSQQQVCQEDGNWSNESIACELIDCPPLQAPENGLLSSLSHDVGAYVTVSCNETYMYFGDAILVCLLGGTWTGSVGHCTDSCKAGTYITEINNVPTCVKCPKGEYQPLKNQNQCLKCNHNSTTVKTGTTKKNRCFPECGIGHGLVYGATKTCKPCSVGQYNQNSGDNPNICKDCPNGLTTDSEGQSICTVPIPIFKPYDIHVHISLIYEAETDCSDASLGEIRETLEDTITEVLELHAKQYIGLCGFEEADCNNVEVSLGNCTSVRKRETTSPLAVDVSIPGIANTVEDTNDSNNKLSTGNVIAEIFETGLEGVQSQLGELNNLQLASTPSVVPNCNPGFVVQDFKCVPCPPGTFWANTSGSCTDCPKDTFQENFAQAQCTDCPELKYIDAVRSDNATACKSFCEVNPANCNYHGKCTATGRRMAECVCYIGYTGTWCEQDINECLTENGGCQNECTNFDGGYACSCLEGYYQDSRDPTKCRVNLFQFGEEAGDQMLQDVNYGCSEPIAPSVKIPIYGTKHDTFYVCANGLISFDDEYWNNWPPGNIEELSDRTILAPFFTDMEFSGTGGAIYYHEYDPDNTISFESNHNVQQAKLYISDIFGKSITLKYLFVATWFQARRDHWSSSYYTWFNEDYGWWDYDYRPENAEKNVTVQLVIASSRKTAYAMYLYGDQQMNWVKTSSIDKPYVFIGYSVKGGIYSSVSSYSYTNLALEMDQYAETADIKGILMYNLKKPGFSPPDFEALCLDWYDELRFQDDHPELALTCPCNVDLMFWDPWFMIFDGYYDLPDSGYDDVECYDSWESWRHSPNAMRCCYDKVSGGWISDERKAGGLIFYHPRSHPTFHQKYDVQMKSHCCVSSDNCDKFRQLRPVGTCYDEFPWELASMFGDPHISTLDGKSYTFNGWGEYVLLKIKTNDTGFSLQCRTERALTEDGKLTDATVFTAFASLDSSNASLLVELAANKAGMVIFGNGVDLTLQFQNKSMPFAFRQSNLILTRQNESLNAFFVATGMKIKISLGTEMLTQEVTVPKEYQGLTEGLLGNFDGNASNDFTFKDGHNIDANSSEREVFPFGQSWMTLADESIFVYRKGLNHANFSHPEFTPKFLDEADPKLVENATVTCGETNLECIFDLVFTRNDKLAKETQYTSVQHAETLVVTHNKIPSLNGTKRIEINSGESIFIPIYAFDEEDVTFTLSEGFDASLMNITGHSAYIYFRASELLGEQLSVMVTDVLGKTSAPFVIEVVICSGCSGHGVCNFKEYKNATKHTNPVKYAKCICDGGSLPYWAGDNCELDFDGCSYQPCSVGQDCIDYNATYHQFQAKAYECSACPDGYDTNNDRCQDRNECIDSNGGCQQACINTEGSFQCLCNSGYRLSTQNPNLCEDIHECDEALHSCQHTCINTVGAYNCSCHQGFRLDVDGFTCIREEDVCADSNIDCSATAGCKRDTGVAQCFCNTGFELSDSGFECVNVDECLENVCSQTCTDTEGSFKCGCQPGFTLENDGTTCVECDESHWGLNCANICKCGQGALRCDRSKGCVCKNGWSEPSCNVDVDECAQTQNVCNDVNKECTNTIGSYECSCRDGFQLDQNEMCEDINECNSLALNECQQICSNVLGSFSCSCNSGYLSDPSDAFKCIDLDECVTGNADCEQLCVNVAGGFNCDCHFGYLLNDDRKTCQKVEDVCAVYGNLNCSHFCVVDATETLCKCPSGYEIGFDNQTCKDIKECDDPALNMCSQPETCQDSEGGFQCSCRIGFKLENDGRTCRPCDAFHFGMNCENKCDCEVGADICDPVSGCICLPGWKGTHCEQDNDECNTEYSPCTGVDTECVNTPGSYKCMCRNGFELTSNGSCIDNNECEAPGLNICDQNCTNTVGSFICTCADGFMFINGSCQDIDECLGLNDCQHECINTVGGHRCRCKPGYILDLTTRKSCIPETECSGNDANTCLSQNAECVMVNGQPTCECQKGYEKDSNDSCADIKECDLTPCSQICLEEDGGYSCQCESGFKLSQDSKTCLACEDGTYGMECSLSCTCNFETTIECDRTTGDCTCKSGWTGNNCSDDIDECSASEDINCTANSECVNTNGSYICECTDGFIKSSHGDCIDIDECVEQTDLCSQDCINIIGGYDCQCLPGYKSSGNNCTDCEASRWGFECQENCLCVPENTENCSSDTGHCFCKTGWSGPRCESDVDECNLIIPCDSTETCENTNGSFVCKCNKGLGREETKGCIDIDECLAGIAECFQECVNTHGSYECRCNQGYKSEGNNCSDIDECAEGTDLCSQDCINTIGSYECQCSAGYKSSGYSCTECESGKWGDECQNDCLCEPENTEICSTDSGHCECQTGWAGPSCETDINECLQEDICDTETEVCENRNGTYDCKCKNGLGRHDVLGCIDIDECIEGLVNCEHFCVNTYGSYNCQCNKGYESHGNNCTDVDECSEGIARCPQECINTEGSYTCNCSAGYQASNYSCAECEDDKWGDECQNDCLCIQENTKSCTSADGHCDCKIGWTGDSCEKDINECFKNDKLCDADTEECENTDGSYKCNCKAGLGRYENVCRDIDECVEELDDCSQDCINTHGSYQCKCRPGFSSSENICTDCEPGKWGYECNETCACVQENTRSCSPVNGYCHCDTGWYGQACENDTDECLEGHSCHSANEVCQNTAGSYKCNCKEGFKRDGDECAVSCLQGTYKSFVSAIAVCMPCPRGEYQDEVDQGFCIQCDSGYTTKSIGSLTSQQCIPECDVGQGLIYGAAKICQPCAKGEYNDKTGENPNLCKECPSGLTTARAGQSVCIVSAPVVSPYQTVIALPLLFEVSTDCGAASLLGIRETIKTTIRTRLMEYEERYQGLCGVDKKSCNDISVLLGSCASLKKREATHILEVNVSISDVSSTIRDTEDQNTSLSTVNLIAELFEADPNGFTPQGGQESIQYVRLAAAPTATVMCDPGKMFADGRCQCPNNYYGDGCSAQCECVTENTVTSTQSCDPDSGKCLCLPTWGGDRCSMDMDECLSGTHDCDAVKNRICQNSINGFNCICKTGYTEGPNQDCIKEKEDNYGLVVGLSIGIPLGVLALVAINLFFCQYLRRSNKKSVPDRNVREEEFVSSLYRNVPTSVPEGTAAFRSIGSWYSAPVTPTPSSSRGSHSRTWIGMSMGENRRLQIDRPKVSTRADDLYQEWRTDTHT